MTPPQLHSPHDPPPMPDHIPLAYAAYDYQRAADESHLKLLVVFHYVWGGLLALFSCIPVVHIFMGVLMVKGKFGNTTGPNAMPPELGWLFIGIGAAVIVLGWTLAGLNFASAHGMRKRQWRMLSLITAGVNCLSVPLGTTLGVFTFIVLLRPSTTQQYAAAASVPTPTTA